MKTIDLILELSVTVEDDIPPMEVVNYFWELPSSRCELDNNWKAKTHICKLKGTHSHEQPDSSTP